jgi:hypothetical protein
LKKAEKATGALVFRSFLDIGGEKSMHTIPPSLFDCMINSEGKKAFSQKR